MFPSDRKRCVFTEKKLKILYSLEAIPVFLFCTLYIVHCKFKQCKQVTVCIVHRARNLRVSLNETPQFPFWRLSICEDFDLRDSKKMENIKKQYNTNIDIHKTV